MNSLSIEDIKNILLNDVIKTKEIIDLFFKDHFSKDSINKFNKVYDIYIVTSGYEDNDSVAACYPQGNIIRVKDDEYFDLDQMSRIMVLIHEYMHAIVGYYKPKNIEHNNSYVVDEALPDIMAELIINYYIKVNNIEKGIYLLTGYPELREVIKPIILILKEHNKDMEALESFLFYDIDHFYKLCFTYVSDNLSDYISYSEIDNIDKKGNTRPYLRKNGIDIIKDQLINLIDKDTSNKLTNKDNPNYDEVLYHENYILEYLYVESIVRNIIGLKDLKDINKDDINKLLNSNINLYKYTTVERYNRFLEELIINYYKNTNNIEDFLLIIKLLKRTPITLFEIIIKDNIKYKDHNHSITYTIYKLADHLKVDDLAESTYLLNIILLDKDKTNKDILNILTTFILRHNIDLRVQLISQLLSSNTFYNESIDNESISNLGIELEDIFTFDDNNDDNFSNHIKDRFIIINKIEELINSNHSYKEILLLNFDINHFNEYRIGMIGYLIEIINYIYEFNNKLIPNYEELLINLLEGNNNIKLNLKLSTKKENYTNLMFIYSGIISKNIDYFYEDIISYSKKCYDYADKEDKELISNALNILDLPFKEELLNYIDKGNSYSIILR